MLRAPALIALAALSVYGSSAFPQGAAPPTGQPAQDVAGTSDEALTKAIYSALDADPNYFFRHVTVRVDKGVATLGGFVNSSSALYRARTIASHVPGVTRVVTNNLQLQPNRPR
jgi:osmotically-inducible protein OsmY